jgi:hypothetical protein
MSITVNAMYDVDMTVVNLCVSSAVGVSDAGDVLRRYAATAETATPKAPLHTRLIA